MSSDGTAERHWNCLNCRRRKVRCDRQDPCSNCVKTQRSCIFPTTGRVFRRPDPLHGAKGKQADLLDRIRRLEHVVDSLNLELKAQGGCEQPCSEEGTHLSSQGPNTNDGDLHSANVSISQLRRDISVRKNSDEAFQRGSQSASLRRRSKVTVSERGSVYVGDKFWASLRHEIKMVRETFDDLESDDRSDFDSSYTPSLLPSHESPSSNASSFLFSNSNSQHPEDSLESLRPLPSEILFVWQTFVDHVAPLVQVLHIPTVTKAIQDCKGRIESLGPAMEALMFSVSFAAVYPMTEKAVKVNFDRNRAEFLSQLRLGTERALARADFINTTSLAVLQAFTIYLFILRRCETARYTWTLLGLLLRIAVSLGLHRDGSCFPDMSPFEAEMRRRLWWNICFIECRFENTSFAEVNISNQNFDTHEPTNVNDADLYPNMTAHPRPREGFTETTMALIRCDIWRLSQTMKAVTSKLGSGMDESDTSIEQKMNVLRSFREKISNRYTGPIGHPIEFVSIMSTVHVNIWELLIEHLRHKGDVPTERSFGLAISIVRDMVEFIHGEATRKWAWLHRGHIQWQPIAIILNRICSRPWDAVAEDAWRLVMKSLSPISEAVTADALWRPLYQLITRTHKYRAEQLRGLEKGTRRLFNAGAQPQSQKTPVPEQQAPVTISVTQPPEMPPLATMPAMRQSQDDNSADHSILQATPLTRPPVRLDALSILSPPISAAEFVNYVQDPNQELPSWLCTAVMDGGYGTGGILDNIEGSAQALDWEEWDEMFRNSRQSWGEGGF